MLREKLLRECWLHDTVCRDELKLYDCLYFVSSWHLMLNCMYYILKIWVVKILPRYAKLCGCCSTEDGKSTKCSDG